MLLTSGGNIMLFRYYYPKRGKGKRIEDSKPWRCYLHLVCQTLVILATLFSTLASRLETQSWKRFFLYSIVFVTSQYSDVGPLFCENLPTEEVLNCDKIVHHNGCIRLGCFCIHPVVVIEGGWLGNYLTWTFFKYRVLVIFAPPCVLYRVALVTSSDVFGLLRFVSRRM